MCDRQYVAPGGATEDGILELLAVGNHQTWLIGIVDPYAAASIAPGVPHGA
ncbi:MAG: hypothetical protein ABI894_01325 [Ilumatobacteraceae bacterium]